MSPSLRQKKANENHHGPSLFLEPETNANQEDDGWHKQMAEKDLRTWLVSTPKENHTRGPSSDIGGYSPKKKLGKLPPPLTLGSQDRTSTHGPLT